MSWRETGEQGVLLPFSAAQEIAEAALAAFPREVCGLLLGPSAHAGRGGAITAVWPIANRSASDDAFFMDPTALCAAYRRAREEGLTVLGHYHSHPNGRPSPSPRDQAAASEAGVLWLIQPCHLQRAAPLRAWRSLGRPQDGQGAFVPLWLRLWR